MKRRVEIEKEISSLENKINAIKINEELIGEALQVLDEYNSIHGHFMYHWKNRITMFCEINVGNPNTGIKPVLKKMARKGFKIKDGYLPEVSALNNGVNWYLVKETLEITLTALIKGTSCQLKQVDTIEKPIYEIICE
jgi:hypothetical protein